MKKVWIITQQDKSGACHIMRVFGNKKAANAYLKGKSWVFRAEAFKVEEEFTKDDYQY